MRRPPHTSPLLRAAALATAPALILAGCSSTNDDAAQPSVTCGEILTGTQTDSSAARKSSQDISTRPESATGYRTGMQSVQTNTYAAATANPLATKAACETLRDGGTAADALVAAQMVLGLVEPQSSGIGGGSFALYYDAKAHKVNAYDGRETAPAAATEDYLRYISPTDQRAPIPSARASGRSIGVPGAVQMLEEIHNEHGRTAWKDLFNPAVSLSDNGFDISPRLATAIAESAKDLKADDDARSYFLNPDGTPKAAGTKLTNPAYAKTLGALATDGAQALYSGPIADAIVAKAGSTSNGMTPSLLTTDDLKNYKAMRREPVSTEYHGHRIVAMPGPSSGGITVAATMGILSNFDIPSMPRQASTATVGTRILKRCI